MQFFIGSFLIRELKNSTKCNNQKYDQDLQALEESFMVVASRPPQSESIDDFKNAVREYNTKEPFCFNTYLKETLIKVSIDIMAN